jgi:hypothetical protein
MIPALVITSFIAIFIALYIANSLYKDHIEYLLEYNTVRHRLYICQQILNARINYA